MKSAMAVCVLMTGLACGCASNVKVSLVDWDSRDAEQLKAAEYVDGVVYDSASAKNEQTERAGFSAWSEAFDMLTKLRIHLRVASVEIGSNKEVVK